MYRVFEIKWNAFIVHRAAQLPGCQSSGVARPGGTDALLVAPDCSVHNALPPQSALPRLPPKWLVPCDLDRGINPTEHISPWVDQCVQSFHFFPPLVWDIS